MFETRLYSIDDADGPSARTREFGLPITEYTGSGSDRRVLSRPLGEILEWDAVGIPTIIRVVELLGSLISRPCRAITAARNSE